MSHYRLILEDVISGCDTLPAASFDAVLCDPPYHLTQKSRGGSPQTGGRQTPFGRARVGTDRGFMGQTWDGGDVAFRPETWTAVARVLKPGAYVLAFGGTRTWHRLAVALEDAGLEIMDTLMWLYGQGFPKSRDMGRDRAEWEGYGTALKPAWEPILLARKSSPGSYAKNLTTWGCGALNVDGARIPLTGRGDALHGGNGRLLSHNRDARPDPGISHNGYAGSPLGRFPANLLLDEESAAALDAQTGVLKSGAMAAGTPRTAGNRFVYGDMDGQATKSDIHANQGGASRFFYTGKVKTRERQAGLPEGLVNDHATLKPIALAEYLSTLLLPPPGGAPRRLLVPFSGAGSEMIGALRAGWETVVGVERMTEYGTIARYRLRHWVPAACEEGGEDALDGASRTAPAAAVDGSFG